MVEMTRSRTSSMSLGQVLDTDFPKPKWISAHRTTDGRQFPQCISHRGYKAAYPENTMRAFRGAVEAGTHALETDIHLTRDDVVVLSHDSTLTRCFGRKKQIIDCDWRELENLQTLKEPRSPLPRLQDLLEYLAQPAVKDIWLLLDIKLDNNAEKVLRLIANTIASVRSGARPWKDRIVLGIWAVPFLPFAVQYLPGYAVAHIGISSRYGREFQRIPNVAMTLQHLLFLAPGGSGKRNSIQRAQRPLLVWTVNTVPLMKWAVQKQIDGVITDDPKTFREVCQNWDDNEPEVVGTLADWLYYIWAAIVMSLLGVFLRTKYPGTVEAFLKRNDMRTKAVLKAEEL